MSAQDKRESPTFKCATKKIQGLAEQSQQQIKYYNNFIF
jgi:hypothetical protein